MGLNELRLNAGGGGGGGGVIVNGACCEILGYSFSCLPESKP